MKTGSINFLLALCGSLLLHGALLAGVRWYVIRQQAADALARAPWEEQITFVLEDAPPELRNPLRDPPKPLPALANPAAAPSAAQPPATVAARPLPKPPPEPDRYNDMGEATVKGT